MYIYIIYIFFLFLKSPVKATFIGSMLVTEKNMQVNVKVKMPFL